MSTASLVCAGLLCISAPVPKVKVSEFAVHLRVGSNKVRLGEPILVFFELHNNTNQALSFTFSIDEPAGLDERVGSYFKVHSTSGNSEEFRPAVLCSTCYGSLLHTRMASGITNPNPSWTVEAHSRIRHFDRILPPTPNSAVNTVYPFPNAGTYEVLAAFLLNGEAVYSKPVVITVIDDCRAFEADATPFFGELKSMCWLFRGGRTWNDDMFSAPDGLIKVAEDYPDSSLPRVLRTIELLRAMEKLKSTDEKLKHIKTMDKAVAAWSEVDAAYLWCQALHLASEDEVVDALSKRITLWDAGAERVRAKREKNK